MKPPKQQLLELTHPQDLPEYVTESRDAGQSWRAIAACVSTDTGFKVSHETLRAWYGGNE